MKWDPRTKPAIWRHGRTIEVPEITFGLRVKGWFVVELLDAATGCVKRRLEFPNLITDAGLDIYFAGTTMLTLTTWCACGTDSTAPAVSQTSLGAEISPSSSNRTNSNGAIADVHAFVGGSFYWSKKITKLFTETQANGNLTEFGLFTANTGGTMWTRQLFKDGGGTPTTIVKTSADQLRITYEYRLYFPSADLVSTKNISGTVYDYTVRPNNVDGAATWGGISGHIEAGAGSSWLGSGGVGPPEGKESNVLVATTDDFGSAGADATPDSVSMAAYTNGTFFRDGTAVWEPGSANFATGFGGTTVGWNGFQNNIRMFQVVFHTTKLPKTNTKRLTLTFRWALTRFP